jgi:lipopolysaccharide transport system permease protein
MATQELEKSNNNWDLIIRPYRGWWDFRFGELWQYRDLIWLLVWRDFVSIYKQTILGPLWYIIQPILTTIVFTIVFGRIAGLSTEGTPPFLFYMLGTTVWSYFSICLLSTSNTFVTNSALFGKVYFPRMCIPVAIVIANVFSFGIKMAAFIVFEIYFIVIGAGVNFTAWILITPLLVFILAGLGLSFGIIVSSMTTKYRDFQFLVTFGVTLMMYATPVIYPLSSVSGIWRLVLLLNPMTSVVEYFRLAFLGTSAISPIWLLYSFAFTLAALLLGILMFNHMESSFIDTV